MVYGKLQVGCLLVLLYLALDYLRKRERPSGRRGPTPFEGLLSLSVACVSFDALTAYFVNYPERVAPWLNRLLHMLFLLSLDAFIFLLFLYMVSITEGIPRERSRLLLLWSPYVLNAVVLIVNIGSLEYRQGAVSNYSVGVSSYTCYIMAGIYVLLSLVTFFRHWHYLEGRKRMSVLTYLLVLVAAAVVQIRFPQALITSIAVTIILLGVYLNEENPDMRRLRSYHREMVMGFSTLVENRDNSTGGHVRRTTAYVELLVAELRRRGMYQDVLTRDYVDDLLLAAPMHDVGKIAVPDAILQKPGKLTPEEFEVMKRHAAKGGEIILDTFSHLGQDHYEAVAFEVARHHHEKWNGRGYPDGLKGEAIPLCARIMAIADVFDAVSQNRCYRAAMPLEECFQIIQAGSGQDFDPTLASIFLDVREQVEKVCVQARAQAAAPAP